MTIHIVLCVGFIGVAITNATGNGSGSYANTGAGDSGIAIGIDMIIPLLIATAFGAAAVGRWRNRNNV